MKRGVVSIVIPTKNSAVYLKDCLESIRKQSYTAIETILIDSASSDDTLVLAKQYGAKVYQFTQKVPSGLFEATYKRNFGAGKAQGDFIYYLDADMILEKNVISQAVVLTKKAYGAVIISEDSFGTGVWAQAKNLERRCYWGDDTIEAPRFFPIKIWYELGGLDESVGGGGDDWDLYQKLLDHGYKVAWTSDIVHHNEGTLQMRNLLKKRYMYGRESLKYIAKRPKAGIISYFPIRRAYIRNWRLFVSRPKDAFFFIIMRSGEYLAGFLGSMYSLFTHE